MKFLVLVDTNKRNVMINPAFVLEVVELNDAQTCLIVHDRREYIFDMPFNEMKELVNDAVK
jgi:hypothetical protein